MAISQDYLQELSQRTDIIELVSSYVQLRRRGRTYTGLCPFHSEKTASFVVYPENSSFYCFGCGAGGDAITFVRKINNLDYIEAVRFLASRAGMPMPDERDDAGKIKRRILEMNKDVARFFAAQLNTEEGRQARGYLRGRALTDATIRHFGLGYSPEGYHTTREYLKTLGYTEEEMLAGGIIKRGQQNGTYDFSAAGSCFRSSICVAMSSRLAAGEWGKRAARNTSTAGTLRFSKRAAICLR